MASQAKCNKCELRFDWTHLKPSRYAKFKIGGIYCPRCGTKLEKTSTWLKKYPTVKDLPLSESGGAFRGPAKAIGPLRMTKKEWMAKGKTLFGEDFLKWRFVCPACRHVQAVGDFKLYKDKGATPDSARCECIGRYDGHIDVDMGAGQPCNYCGNGLFRLSPVLVIDENSKETAAFAFDEGPETLSLSKMQKGGV
jgi:hypothetical protein